jgi:hypothetical protein
VSPQPRVNGRQFTVRDGSLWWRSVRCKSGADTPHSKNVGAPGHAAEGPWIDFLPVRMDSTPGACNLPLFSLGGRSFSSNIDAPPKLFLSIR